VSRIELTTSGGLLLQSAERRPDGGPLVFPERWVTYAALTEGPRRLARGLHAPGVGRGDHAAEPIESGRGKPARFKASRYARVVQEWPMSATKIRRFRRGLPLPEPGRAGRR